MNLSNSEFGSGRESGWTTYLDQSLNPSYQFQNASGRILSEEEDGRNRRATAEENEEDLSMVSDASSGPPHFQEDGDCFDENGYYCYGRNSLSELPNRKEKKKKIKEQRGQKQNLHLDDTASSQILSFSKKHIVLPSSGGSMEHPLGFSSSLLKGKSALQKHFGLFKSSGSGKPSSGAPGGNLEGRKWQ